MSWLSLPLEGGHPLFSQIEKKVGRWKGLTKSPRETTSVSSISFHCPHPLLPTFHLGASSIYSRGLEGRLLCSLPVSLPGKVLILGVLGRRATTRAGATILRGRLAARPFVLFITGEGGGSCGGGGGFASRVRPLSCAFASWELVGGLVGDAAGRPRPRIISYH